MSLDELALELVKSYDYKEQDAAVLRFDGDTIAVICMDTKTALELMRRAIEELTAPTGATIQ